MSLQTFENIPRTVRELPQSAENTAVLVSDIVSDFVPYQSNNEYKLDRAIERRSGTCYAQTLATLAVLESFDIPGAVVLEAGHAHAVMSKNNEHWFINPNSDIRNSFGEALLWRNDSTNTLAEEYERTLPDILHGEDVGTYYYRPVNVDGDLTWRSIPSEQSYTCPDFTTQDDAHVILSSDQAEDTLHTIGDLKRWSVTKPEKYVRKYDELIDFVPRIIHLPAPEEVVPV